MKRKVAISGLYRFSIIGIVVYDFWLSGINQTILILMSILGLYAIIFSALWENKIISYIEWFVILGLVFLIKEEILLLLLFVPLLQIATTELKFYENIILPVTSFFVFYGMKQNILIAALIGIAVLLILFLTNDKLRKIRKLEKDNLSYRNQVQVLRKENTKKENQINITSKLFYEKRILENASDLKTLIGKLINSAFNLYNANYVVFYYYSHGNYKKIAEKGDKKGLDIPDVLHKREVQGAGFEDKVLKMPIFFQKQPWGYLVIYGKKITMTTTTKKIELNFVNTDFEILTMLIETVLVRLKEIKRREKLETAAFFDRLTNVPNRSYLERKLFKEKVEQMRTLNRDLYVVMFDIDNFKSFNDEFGHDIGDIVLQNVARAADETLKKYKEGDVIGRWGGEEFLGFLFGSKEEVYVKAEEIRKNIENLKFKYREITVSVGLAKVNKHRISLEETTKNADIALYRSKNNGKNQVTIFEEGMGQ